MENTAQIEKPVVLCAVCGGIAAYKAVDVVSQLHKNSYDVHVIMTKAAQQFVAPLTFQAILGRRIITSMFTAPESDSHEEIYPHLYPATAADIFVLLPATADILAKIAQGLADDLVSASVLGLAPDCPRFFCPSMNTNMWHQPVVQQNVRTLLEQGWIQIGPGDGLLACGTSGTGRMSEPADIVTRICNTLSMQQTLSDKRVLILSGPTHEHLDPVRYIGNASSGKMGKALADAASARGAVVDFVSGPVPPANLPCGKQVHIHPIISAQDMLEKASPLFPDADIIIFAAAVADYAPAEPHETKQPKTADNLSVALVSTPDIAATLCAKKTPRQVAIGFALQDDDAQQRARQKRDQKGLDAIVLNTPAAMGADRADYAYLAKDQDHFTEWGHLTKPDCAQKIITHIIEQMDA